MKNIEIEEIANPNLRNWIKVKQPEKINRSVVDELNTMHRHHVEETEFLINKCRELAREVAAWREAMSGSAYFDGNKLIY